MRWPFAAASPSGTNGWLGCASFAAFAIASFGEGVMQTAFWVFVERTLGGGTREAGWLLSAQAAGGLAGAMAIGGLTRNRSPVALLGWGAIGMGLADLATFNYPAVIPGIWLGMLFMAAGGPPGTAFITGYVSSVQLEATDDFRGRVFGALSAISALFMTGGAAVAGLATGPLGPVPVLSIDALGYAGGGLLALRVLAATSGAGRTALADG